MKLAVLSREIEENLNKGSWIRKLFDEGARLKKEFGDDQVFDFHSATRLLNRPKLLREH